MHIVQIMLVEADSEKEAYEKVASKLERSPGWSDWHNANGVPPYAGRWTGGVFLTEAQVKALNETEDPTAIEAITSTVPDILCYADDPELADYTLGRFAGGVKQQMRESMPVGLDLNSYIEEYNSYGTNSIHFATPLYELKRVVDTLSGEWTPDSQFFDLVYGRASLHHFSKRCEKEPHRQFLVPVDFHF